MPKWMLSFGSIAAPKWLVEGYSNSWLELATLERLKLPREWKGSN
jgi:hypothetical protein